MRAKSLSTLTCHMINSYGNTAKNVIHAYRTGGERVVGMLEQRWTRALKQSRPQLAADVAKNATTVQQALHSYSLKGLTRTSAGAQNMVNRMVKLADAGVHAVSVNAARFEDKTGARALSSLAQAAIPGATALSALVSQIERKSAHLVTQVAGDKAIKKVAKRTRTPRQPTAASAT
jgi:hypothetical protein